MHARQSPTNYETTTKQRTRLVNRLAITRTMRNRSLYASFLANRHDRPTMGKHSTQPTNHSRNSHPHCKIQRLITNKQQHEQPTT